MKLIKIQLYLSALLFAFGAGGVTALLLVSPGAAFCASQTIDNNRRAIAERSGWDWVRPK